MLRVFTLYLKSHTLNNLLTEYFEPAHLKFLRFLPCSEEKLQPLETAATRKEIMYTTKYMIGKSKTVHGYVFMIVMVIGIIFSALKYE